ncbi:MAG: valine--tRNA ligase [Candidatus Cloacimonetes bacterium]|nr:valine--tRNA ligase [Candidatus Cloacimonadota bacterium]MCB5286417.1 valine--tRNA ligase [Candidatus Cloacimonadota bacterium]MCK9184236.1 valine--tRNA ligase [Candidatus Cloacimonadota bacterium]MDY0228739.1 valine--tRNA ligase [Candidatus Cloacimonadaceae bacterium]
MEIKKTYSPEEIENKWYSFWDKAGYFAPQGEGKAFTVLIPPPNVTGILHMGHVLNNTLQDVVVRYHRMQGQPTLWLPGVDHAGIATQNMVEKQLAKEGKTRHEIGREALVERIWAWKHEKGDIIIDQLKLLGASCDWGRQRFTMDEMLTRAVKEVFVSLYEDGLIYKGKYITNWCPRCVTALANDEVEHADEKGKLWHVHYPFASGKGFVTVATTRPETMLGDVAVAVNPTDKRYKELIGKELLLPLTDRRIPIIADDYVDKDFGTGCVKVTPAHDPNDFEIGRRHDLQQILIMDEHGKMNEEAGAEFAGLDRFAARKKALKMLEEQNLLGKIQDHEHAVGHCYRCDTVIEPYLSDQWFVKMQPLAVEAIRVVEEGEVKFQPERWSKVYMHWMNNIRDWCISRQIWWGHRIPAYYCNDCDEMMVAKEQPASCPKCGSTNLRQDEDVLDTWFSSWLWPFSTMGWPDETEDLKRFLPTNVLITAPEIIYLWVARMIMSTLHFKKMIPFDTVLLHGIVRDEIGRKMSKSLGNSPDPIDIIKQVGADALRFSMIFNTPKGADLAYSDNMLETGRNFANKIWNAYRFIMMNMEAIPGLPKPEELQLELADRWIISRLNEVSRETAEHYENLRLNDAAQCVFQFLWNEYCSWYIELAKDRLKEESPQATKLTAKYILLNVMQAGMRLLHPIMPFISEEIWQSIKELFPMPDEALIIAKFPQADDSLIDPAIDDEMRLMQESITAIRNLRNQLNLPPATQISIVVRTADKMQNRLFVDYAQYLARLAKVEKIESGETVTKPKPAVSAVVRNMEIFLPLAGLIDPEVERARLGKQLEKLEKELMIISKKLANKNFVEHAKAEVVEKEREKYTEVHTKVELTQAQIADL